MTKIEHIDILPKALRVLARAFIEADEYSPEIYEMTTDEISELRLTEEVVIQFILDKEYANWYLVVVGDCERVIESELIAHNPFLVKRGIMGFAPVSDAFIRAKRREYEKDMINETPMELDRNGQWKPTRWI